jgi:hypothetical protein
MLSESKIIALYCIVDDILKTLHHSEDKRARVSDSEVITTAFVSVLYFGGHWDNARHFMQLKGYVPAMLDKSRFCRRLHRLNEQLYALFWQLGHHLKQVAGASDYRLDAFPVAVCDNIRIPRCKLLQGAAFRGYQPAMRRYFYGVKVQVLTLEGLPVELALVPGREQDYIGLRVLPLQVSAGSCIYADSAYLDYQSEQDALQAEGIQLLVQRKSDSRLKDPPHMTFVKQYMRKGIETTFSGIKAKMPRSIHAVSQAGFLLKTALFVIAYTFEQITPN